MIKQVYKELGANYRYKRDLIIPKLQSVLLRMEAAKIEWDLNHNRYNKDSDQLLLELEYLQDIKKELTLRKTGCIQF